MIAFLDLGASFRELQPQLDAAIARVTQSGWYIGGVEVERFEASFAQYTGSVAAVGCGNGLDALILSLMALEIGPGDEVLVPAHTFIATWLAVSRVGAVPVPVDVCADTLNMDADRLVEYITPSTKAVIPVHIYGNPVNLPAILEVARAHDLYVIEDAAQAHGAEWNGVRIGGRSDAACWSFYPAKNLGALGDGGMVTTRHPDLADRIRRIGNYGSERKYENLEIGLNSRLDPLQAAVLDVKLQHLDAWNARRADIARIYLDGLADSGLTLPVVPEEANAVWHLFVVRSQQRDQLQKALETAGVQTQIHYPIAPFEQTAFASLGLSGSNFPVAQDAAQRVLSLPMGPHLSLDAAHGVVDAIASLDLTHAA